MAAAPDLRLRVVKMDEEGGATEANRDEKHENASVVDDDGAKPSPSSSPAAQVQGNDAQLNAYELERERNIARNRARMEAVVGKEVLRRTRRIDSTSTASVIGKSTSSRRTRHPRPSSSPNSTRTMPTRSSRRLTKTSPSPPPPDSREIGDRSLISRTARPVIPSRFVRGISSFSATAGDDAEALRELNEFRASYMSRAALFNRVMAVSNLLKLEDFAAVLDKDEGTKDLAALAKEKLSLMKKGDARAVKEFVLRSKEIENERREREREEEVEKEAKEEGE